MRNVKLKSQILLLRRISHIFLYSQYIYQNSNILVHSGTFESFLAGLEQKSSVLCMLLCPNGPSVNQCKLDQQSRQQVLRASCSNIYTVAKMHLLCQMNNDKTHFCTFHCKTMYLFAYVEFYKLISLIHMHHLEISSDESN